MSVRTPTVVRPRARLHIWPGGRLAVLAALVIVMAIFLVVPVRQYLAERSKVAWLQQREAEVTRANAKLGREIQQLHDPQELERLARECLGMVRPGEVAFVVVPRGGQPQPSHC